MRQLRLLAFMVMILPVHDCAAASGTSDVMPCGEHGAPGTRHAESGKQTAHYLLVPEDIMPYLIGWLLGVPLVVLVVLYLIFH